MREVNPMETNRALSFQMFIDAPMPMVTIFKTLNISNLIKLMSNGYKLNMLMCYCVAYAANQVPEFKLLPINKKMYEYDKLGVNLIVANKKGSINSCDVPFSEDLNKFNQDYLELTNKVYESCENYNIEDHMIVGTSCLAKYDIDGIVNMYSGVFNNPFLAWGKYIADGNKTILKVSFQFHHVQMDGMEACEFLEKLQGIINNLRSA